MLKTVTSILTSNRGSGADAFAPVLVDVLARDMELERKAQEQAESERPASTSADFDSTEQEIERVIRGKASEAQTRLNDQLSTYAERLRSADASGAAANMRVVATQAVANFEAELVQVQGDLTQAFHEVESRRKQLEEFRREHDLKRSANPPKAHLVMIAILLVMFLFEVLPNATLISLGAEGGLIGGFMIAILFSGLSLALGFISGILCFNRVAHKDTAQKVLGLVCGGILWLGVIAISFAVAHYRAAIMGGMSTEDAGTYALRAIVTTPMALGDIISILMIGFGLLFAFVATIEGLKWQDPYPGYAAKDRHLRNSENTFNYLVRESLDDLKAVEKEYVEQIKSERASLRDRRLKIPHIIEERKRLTNQFHAHLMHLEDAGRALLSIYRDANRRARSTPEPSRFDLRWELKGIALPTFDDATWITPEHEFVGADEALAKSISELTDAHQRGIAWIKEKAAIARGAFAHEGTGD